MGSEDSALQHVLEGCGKVGMGGAGMPSFVGGEDGVRGGMLQVACGWRPTGDRGGRFILASGAAVDKKSVGYVVDSRCRAVLTRQIGLGGFLLSRQSRQFLRPWSIVESRLGPLSRPWKSPCELGRDTVRGEEVQQLLIMRSRPIKTAYSANNITAERFLLLMFTHGLSL
jgi:hypothetical protein